MDEKKEVVKHIALAGYSNGTPGGGIVPGTQQHDMDPTVGHAFSLTQ